MNKNPWTFALIPSVGSTQAGSRHKTGADAQKAGIKKARLIFADPLPPESIELVVIDSRKRREIHAGLSRMLTTENCR